MSVTEPLDTDDNSTQSTEFQSVEIREDGSLKPVTVYSFHRYRTKLYRIAARLQTRNHASQPGFGDETRNIHQELDKIRTSLPPELCLDSYSKIGFSEEGSAVGRIFRLQALTLRVLCEHIQLLLFRPCLACDAARDSPLTHGNTLTTYAGLSVDEDDADIATLARLRCVQSAMRIARVDQHQSILHMASKTPLVTHLGVVSFTSGAILGTLGLMDPTSSHARECKMGLARIIKLPKICNFSNALWDQATETLKDVLKVICSEEVETLLVGNIPPSPTQSVGEERTPAMGDAVSGRLQEPSDGMPFSGVNLTGLEDMELFTECFTAFTDLYGPSIGL